VSISCGATAFTRIPCGRSSEITMATDTEALVRRAYHLAEGDVLDV
jgi:hypothetical protein